MKPSDPTIAEKFNTYRFADYTLIKLFFSFRLGKWAYACWLVGVKINKVL
jgi:hypothetical protein